MLLEQSQQPSQNASLNISAKFIASIKVSQYSSEELDQAISRESQENPALEVEEPTQCLRCGATLRAGICPSCERSSSRRRTRTARSGGLGRLLRPASRAGAANETTATTPWTSFVRGVPCKSTCCASSAPRSTTRTTHRRISHRQPGFPRVSHRHGRRGRRSLARPVERVERAGRLPTLDPPASARATWRNAADPMRTFEELGEASRLVRPLLEKHKGAGRASLP